MARPPDARSWRPVFMVAALCEVVLSALVASSGVLVRGDWHFVALLGAWAAAFAVAAVAALRMPAGRAALLIALFGVAMRAAALAGGPTTSNDLYRYAWDGRVQAAGIDPYAWAPSAPQLRELREPWLWPDPAGCAALHRAPGCTRINRPAERTIYPPVAEAFFAGVYRVGGLAAHAKSWQVAGLAIDTATLGLLAAALRRWGKDGRWLALYALCPAPALEFVDNAHIDVLAVAFVAAALLIARPPPGRLARPRGEVDTSGPSGLRVPWRLVATCGLVACAALVKVYPAVLIVPLVAAQRGSRLKAALWCGAATLLAFAVAYTPHVIAVGTRVLGYLPGYLAEEGYRSGGRYLIPHLVSLPSSITGAVAIGGAAVALAFVLQRRRPLPQSAGLALAAALLAATPAQPWYAVALLAVATVAARPVLTAVVAAAYGAALPVVLLPHLAATLGGISYAAAAVIVAAACLLRRDPAEGPGMSALVRHDGVVGRTSGIGRVALWDWERW